MFSGLEWCEKLQNADRAHEGNDEHPDLFRNEMVVRVFCEILGFTTKRK